MVLLQGLIFGRTLMDSLARRGAVAASPVSSGAHLTRRTRMQRRAGTYRGFRRSIANPYETTELLQRLGGSSVRHLTTKTSATASARTSLSQSLEELLKDEIWMPVYRFRGIHYGILAARTKLALTLSSMALIPYKYWQYVHDEISISHFISVSAFASFTTLALILFCRFFIHLIGVISMNETNEYVRIGYLSFWGYRRNKYVELGDILPLSESATVIGKNQVVRLKQYSSKDILHLPTFNVELVDRERATLLFGDISVFESSTKKDK